MRVVTQKINHTLFKFAELSVGEKEQAVELIVNTRFPVPDFIGDEVAFIESCGITVKENQWGPGYLYSWMVKDRNTWRKALKIGKIGTPEIHEAYLRYLNSPEPAEIFIKPFSAHLDKRLEDATAKCEPARVASHANARSYLESEDCPAEFLRKDGGIKLFRPEQYEGELYG